MTVSRQHSVHKTPMLLLPVDRESNRISQMNMCAVAAKQSGTATFELR
jgi:hypothetical protein